MKEKEKAFAFRGRSFVIVVLVTYGILFFLNSEKTFVAAQKSFDILMKVVPILFMVILFTAFLNYVLQPKQIVKHLGEDSGAKGWFVALFAGIISHGPMYAWYPLIEELQRHGLKDKFIIIFFYSRAVKLPLLPLMIDYFGLIFTCILTFYILIGALFQGFALEFLQANKRQIK